MNARAQTGVALLTVLLMVVVISVLVIAMLDDIRFGLRRSTNAESLAQARWHAQGAEAVARNRIALLHRLDPQRTTLAGDWADRPVRLPLPNGYVQAELSDATHCFNLNSVVQGANDLVIRRENGVSQFIALAQGLEVPESQARMLADNLVDWIDSDQQPSPAGHEDSSYRRGRDGYVTGATLLAEPSELRAIHGFDANVYERLRPWVCALPTTAPTPVNVNTLGPDAAPLLQMLAGRGLTPSAARVAIAARPEAGWQSISQFWATSGLRALQPDNDTLAQAAVRTRLFRARVRVENGPAQAVLESLIEQGDDGRTRLLARQWNLPE